MITVKHRLATAQPHLARLLGVTARAWGLSATSRCSLRPNCAQRSVASPQPARDTLSFAAISCQSRVKFGGQVTTSKRRLRLHSKAVFQRTVTSTPVNRPREKPTYL